MNLHGVANGAITAVNPNTPATWKKSSGYATNPDGSRVPSYLAGVTLRAQVQALQWRDLQQLDGLNLNGLRRAMYLFGDVEGVVRSRVEGGDLIAISLGAHKGTWLVAQVLETWDGTPQGWCKVACTLQPD